MRRAPDFSSDSDSRSVMNITVPLWAVWSVVVFFVIGTFYFVTLLNTINGKLSKPWNRDLMREYARREAKENPTVHVPDPDQIAKDLE